MTSLLESYQPLLESYLESLTMVNVVLGGLALVTLLVLGQFTYNVTLHPLAGFPGPLLYGGSNLPKMAQQVRGNVHETMLELHERYGPVVRLAPNELTYTSDTALSEIYGNRGGKKTMPPQSALGKNDARMFGATSFTWLEGHAEHMHRRKILGASFSDKALKDQEPTVLKYTALMSKQLRKHAADGREVVDVWAWFNYLTFDIIGDLTFGEPFDCVKDGKFHPWITFIFSNLTMMMYGQMVLTMGRLGTFLERLVPEKIWAEATSHAAATRDKVDWRLKDEKRTGDFISTFQKHVDQPGGITRHELYADANIFVMAGSETSATLLAVAVYYLLRNPDKLALLQREVRGVFPRKPAAADEGEADINFSTVAELPYLLAVINESLRIHPALPAGINRCVPQGGAMIDGRFVAEGTILQVAQWPAFHLEENFKDPWSFVPERWLKNRPARYVDDNHKVFQPFSYGARGCIGRGLAMMEARVTLARMLWNFDMELMPESLDWSKQKVFLLWEKRPLYVKLTDLGRPLTDVGEAEKENS